MADTPSFNVALVVVALSRARGVCELQRIYTEIQRMDPEWRSRYRSEDSFQATVRKTIEDHCPQSENYSTDRPAMFERVGPGRYRLIKPEERGDAEGRGRRLDQ